MICHWNEDEPVAKMAEGLALGGHDGRETSCVEPTLYQCTREGKQKGSVWEHALDLACSAIGAFGSEKRKIRGCGCQPLKFSRSHF